MLLSIILSLVEASVVVLCLNVALLANFFIVLGLVVSHGLSAGVMDH